MIQKKKIVWLTPFLHPVYEGWIFFRSKYFDLTIYTPDENKEFNLFLSEKIHFHKLEVTKNHLITKSNFFCFFDV
ncbi:MAG: hypothetical protein LBQ59_00800 [Candidatus Peribacteria bacterium]|jgi:hypothetical protein|nr:hypothetical protein [Candidatus Peribacteria bacterium]